jgi:para-aminobenzoate synthetase / 4-amino-4-deoxychorismate lyase
MRMPRVIFHQPRPDGGSDWLCGLDLVGVVQTRQLPEVRPTLEQVQRAAEGGLYAAGFISYEAAGGIDPHLATHPCGGPPLLWFALFRRMAWQEQPPAAEAGSYSIGPWQPSVSPQEYAGAVARVREYIAAGDTYQVNYTFRLHAGFQGDPWPFFARLCRAQRGQYSAYIDTGDWAVCSASPEMFFSLDAGVMVCRPMKGTAARGLTFTQDVQLREGLRRSAKDRAENAMIVDMMRNDMGRVAKPGSVIVASAFDVEKYPTLYQMTSTVRAATAEPFGRIVEALFPCASITGAPKVRTMQIIRELEPTPRGVYTGCIGYLTPAGSARFSVAIRTAVIDRAAGTAEYGVGGAIVWDSTQANEYVECQTKAAVLEAEAPEFDLLEAILHDGDHGWFLFDEHLRRLAESAEYFDFAADLPVIRQRLQEFGAQLGGEPAKVRLRLERGGRITVESVPVSAAKLPAPLSLKLADKPVDDQNVFLYHKTTCRGVYESAHACRRGCDDVVLWNTHGQVTETTFANIVVELEGRRVTPPVDCGLLAGVFRGHLLATGEIAERIVTVDDLGRAGKIWAVNSVRKWMPAALKR